jgi:hypothetical protein
MKRSLLLLCCLIASCAAGVSAGIVPAKLVPARWNLTDVRSLDLVSGTAINCLLIDWSEQKAGDFSAFAEAAGAKNVDVFAVIHPGQDTAKAARAAISAKARGIVLEGEFPANMGARVRDAVADTKTLVVEITPRGGMNFNSGAPIIGTYQGVWPGVQVEAEGKAAHAGPSAAAWIDTNTGFLQAARALSGGATIWIAIGPPAGNVFRAERYLQAVGDAAITGSRWVLAFDSDTRTAIEKREPGALKTWKTVTDLLAWFERHDEWRTMPSGGKLAILQDADHGALVTGGILDMISTKHTPIRPLPPAQLTAEALKGATMAVDTEPDSLSEGQRQILLDWRRSGGTLLTAPAGWKEAMPSDRSTIRLTEEQFKRIDDMWHDVSNMIGRRNLGVRLFNVSSMLSTFLAGESGRPAIVQLNNYSDYPVENVTVQLLGKYTKARLYTPDGKEKALEVYEAEDGTGIDIDLVQSCAALRVE